MFRRTALLVSLAGLMVAVMLPTAASARTAKPNVLVVMTDDMSYDNLKFMPKTTAFFKKNGTSFTKSYVTYPLCCPARATFLTGQLAHNHGVHRVISPDNYIGWKTKENNMAAWLQTGGYRTGVSGKYLNGYRAFGVSIASRLVRPPGVGQQVPGAWAASRLSTSNER